MGLTSLVLASLTLAAPALAQSAPPGAPVDNRAENPVDSAAHPVDTAAPGATPDAREHVRFEADKVTYNDDEQIVIASGNVVIRRTDQTVRADTVTWNRKTGAIVANGNIRFVDEFDNVLYTEQLELTDEFKAGATADLLVVLHEGGRLAARQSSRDNAGNMRLQDANYSGCYVVDGDGCARHPSWNVTAVRVTYNETDKRIRYYGATLRIFGVPILPLVGFSNPADFRAASGTLIPEFRMTTSNGFQISETYYSRLSDSRDLAVTGTLFSKALPMVSAKYRELDSNGAFQITGYATRSRQTDATTDSTGALVTTGVGNVDFRGYGEISGRYQFGEDWSITGYGRYVSDRTFLLRYTISSDDRLRSTFNLEHVNDDSYFSFAGWAVQAIRVTDVQGQVPIALPTIDYRRRLMMPGIGGTLELEANTLALTRTAGQDTQRAFARAQWDWHTVTGWGQELTLTGLARSDVYHSANNDLTADPAYQGDPGWQARVLGTAAVDLKWPLVGEAFGGTQVLTPRIQVVSTPAVHNLAIPNEDSRAIELDDSNVFSLNRLSGYDRVEDGTRITYGFDWRLDRPGWRAATTIGESYRFSRLDSLVPEGTGLAGKVSDVVGRAELRFQDIVQFTERFQLDPTSFKLRRNEFDATLGDHRNYFEVGYLSLRRDLPTTYENLLQGSELEATVRAAFAKYWSVFGAGVANLTSSQTTTSGITSGVSNGFEMLRHRLGFAYTDDCLDLAFTWRRDYVTTGDAVKGSSFTLNLTLRSIGSH